MSLFSIVIPALNEEKYLPRLLSSLTKQTCRKFDVVVVDGSSKDQTVARARAFGEKLPGLQVCISSKASVSLQRNLGARASAGEWLVFADADSTLLPYALERLADFIAEQQPQLFTVWFRPDSETAGDGVFMLLTNVFVEASILLHRPVAPGPLMVIRRDVFEQAGGFDEAVTFGEDYDLTQRIKANGGALQILRETLAVMSLRRVRKLGRARFLLIYAKASVRILFTKRSPGTAVSYVMGGQFYEGEHA